MPQLPTRILKEPLIDSTVEIRFESEIDKSAVFGVIYFALRDTYTRVEHLPILQLPEQAINDDPFMSSQPRYRIHSSKFNLQIGPNTLAVHCNDAYLGWREYSEEIFRVVEVIRNLSILKNVTRVGLRYVNFLPYNLNIFRDLQLKLIFPGRNLKDLPTTIRLILPDEDFLTKLQIANLTEVNRDDKNMMGSLIDIDTHRTENLHNFFSDFKTIIDQAHRIEKSIFFSLFTDDYLESLEPVYNENESN